VTGPVLIHSALALAVMAVSDTVLGQERETMRIDIAQLAPNLEAEFMQWRVVGLSRAG